eukprot:366539-Chlamydomonas_euryale.AAC.21
MKSLALKASARRPEQGDQSARRNRHCREGCRQPLFVFWDRRTKGRDENSHYKEAGMAATVRGMGRKTVIPAAAYKNRRCGQDEVGDDVGGWGRR